MQIGLGTGPRVPPPRSWWEEMDADEDGLRYYQRDAYDRILAELQTVRSTLCVMATGLGKAQPLDAQVLTSFGWQDMGSVVKGQYIFGSDGRKWPITGIFPQGEKPIYRVEFSDDTETRCCGEHLWAVRTRSQKKRGAGYQVRSTEELMGDLEEGGGPKWYVPVVQPIRFHKTPLPLDPYLVGVLIGDGSLTKCVKFSSADPYIVERLRVIVPDLFEGNEGYEVKYDAQYDYRISGRRVGRGGSKLIKTLKTLGMWGKLAHQKSIPKRYLMACVDDRMELLRGLMDTDGYANGFAAAEITTSSPSLAVDILDLVRSLGGTSRIRYKTTTHRPAYRLLVNTEQNPFALPRKAMLYRGDARGQRMRSIKSIRPAGSAECQCISVGAPDNLYVTDDYLLTHNTELFAAIAKHWDGNVLILAHRDELVEQARIRIEKMTGEWVEVEQGQYRSHEARIVVGSVQTVQRKNRLEQLGKDRFDLIVFDEAHHAIAKTYRRPLDFFANAKILGVTATPDRGDERALAQVFDTVAYVMDILQGIEAGYLVPLEGHRVHLDQIDISSVGKVAKELNQGQLDEVLLKACEGIVRKTLELQPDRNGLLFFPGVKSAHYAADKFNLLKPGSAICIDGKTDTDDRRRMVRDFKAGEFQYLCNCMIATEGFDAPAADLVVPRLTLSRALYAQQVGRITRVLPSAGVGQWSGPEGAQARREAVAASAKPNGMILDFVGNSGKHDLCSAVEVLGGNHSEAEVKHAKKIVEKSPTSNLVDALERAREELRALAAATTARVQATVSTFNPFGVLHLTDDGDKYTQRFGWKAATAKQVATLNKWGVKEADTMSLQQASRMLESMFKRKDLGLANYKQLKVLQKWGVAEINVSFERASQAIDYIASTGWGKKEDVNRGKLDHILKGERQPGEERGE